MAPKLAALIRKGWVFLAESLKNHDRGSWCCRQLKPILLKMLLLAGYSRYDISQQLKFFSRNVAPFLGRYPTHSRPQWHSFMTDDGTPIEISWSWKEGESRPTVRYSIEPVGRMAGLRADPRNLYMGKKFLEDAKKECKDVELSWFYQLNQFLCWNENEVTQPTSGQQDSQIFFAFDLLGPERILKAYFMPELKARQNFCSTFNLVMKAVAGLSLDPLISSAFDTFSEFYQLLQQKKDEDLEVEILAIDCLQPYKSRIKIYFRSQRTSFDDIVEIMTLGGNLQDQDFDDGLHSLRQLWYSVLSLNSDFPTSSQLPINNHRTAGILFYFEFKPGSSVIRPKLYIPARHYGVNDLEIACGISSFLGSRGMFLYGTTYESAVQGLCSHRDLQSGLGFHTYVTCSIVKGKLNVTTYFNPEIFDRMKNIT